MNSGNKDDLDDRSPGQPQREYSTEMADSDTCGNCGKNGSEMKKCAVCKAVYYCDKW